MILNLDRTQAVSNLGWVDKGALWLYSAGSAAPCSVVLSNAKFITILAGKNDFFAAVHHWDGERLEITAHHHSEPAMVVSRALVLQKVPAPGAELTVVFKGDASVWSQLPSAYTAYAFGQSRLIRTSVDEYEAVQEFEWFDDSYDKGYQGIIGVTDVPDSRNLIISIQRDSSPILYDPMTKQAIKKLTLAGRRGNPEFLFRASANEFWASDYDSIVKLDAKTLTVKQSLQIQPGVSGSGAFIGNFCFDRAEKICVIARPFSHDALVLEADSMRQLDAVKLPGNPLDIGLLADRTPIARDWKTGKFLSAKPMRIR